MCYLTLLSTDSAEDLTPLNTELMQFSMTLPGAAEERHLAHSNKWFVGSRSGCSCGFRHLYIGSVDLGFGEPQDWYPEDPEDLEATLQLAAVIRRLVASGASVDCVDAWPDGREAGELAGTVHVNLAALGDRQFRLFENHRFVFSGMAP